MTTGTEQSAKDIRIYERCSWYTTRAMPQEGACLDSPVIHACTRVYNLIT